MIRVEAAPFDPEAELAAFRAAQAPAGAIASFLGCVRGGGTEALILEHHPVLTAQAIHSFADGARQRFELLGLLIIHRFGRLAPAEPIVLVAAAALHRRPALQAVDYLMDLLKTEAPFWKREALSNEERWIEPHQADYAARDRWTAPIEEKTP